MPSYAYQAKARQAYVKEPQDFLCQAKKILGSFETLMKQLWKEVVGLLGRLSPLTRLRLSQTSSDIENANDFAKLIVLRFTVRQVFSLCVGGQRDLLGRHHTVWVPHAAAVSGVNMHWCAIQNVDYIVETIVDYPKPLKQSVKILLCVCGSQSKKIALPMLKIADLIFKQQNH